MPSYLSVYQSALFSLGVKRADGSELSYDQVVDQLSEYVPRFSRQEARLSNSFTVSQSAHFSYRGVFSEVFVISIKVEKADYEKAVGWIRDLVNGVVFVPERRVQENAAEG